MTIEWSLPQLIRTAKAFDQKARRLRNENTDPSVGMTYAESRRIAFTARSFARTKEDNE